MLVMTTPTTTAFHSDNTAGASPAIAEAMLKACSGLELPYGGDSYSVTVEQQLRDIFETDVSVFLVPTGTAANCLSLATMTPPWGAILCHQESHINNDECGAPEFFTHGAKLISVAGDDSKIDPQALAQQAGIKRGDVHSVQASCVSISQATESGSIYSLDHIHAISDVCQAHGMGLHMDGARFANALLSLNCTAAEMTWKAGVKALSFGATKNGTLGVDAIVLFDQSLAQELAYRRKRAGHLSSKMRLFSAQMSAYLDNDLWLQNAQHANAMAARLATGLSAISGVEMFGASQSNILFCRLPEAYINGLLEQGFGFYHDRWGKGVVRLVTSFAHTEEQVDSFIAATQKLSQQ